MSGSGETDLSVMLKSLTPELVACDAGFAFCHVPAGSPDPEPALLARALMQFREAEGLTLIIDAAVADSAGLEHDGVYACITLKVHSSLEAVGLTAAVSSALGEAAIPANVVAAYYHDHVFVPAPRAGEAIGVLEGLSKAAESDPP